MAGKGDGKLLAVSVSGPRTLEVDGERRVTCVFKERVQGPIRLGPHGLEGDGPGEGKRATDEAVYCYAAEHYGWWMDELDRDDFAPGQFGENFTTAGLREGQVAIGDVYRIGDAKVQVSQPRNAGVELGWRMGDASVPSQVVASKLSGFYLRVLEPGVVEQGATIALVERPEDPMSVLEVFELLHIDLRNLAGAKRALALEALAATWKAAFELRLRDAGILDVGGDGQV